MSDITITYNNWLGDEVELTLKPLMTVAGFDEMIKLKAAEDNDDNGKYVFDKTMEFFIRAFETQDDANYFLSHSMEIVTDVMEVWLEESYRNNKRSSYKKLLEEVLNETDEEDYEEDGLTVSFLFDPEEKSELTTKHYVIIGGSLLVFSGAIVVGLLTSFTFGAWATVGMLSLLGLSCIVMGIALRNKM